MLYAEHFENGGGTVMKRLLFFSTMAVIITVFALTGCEQKVEEEAAVEEESAVAEEPEEEAEPVVEEKEAPAVAEEAVKAPEPAKADEEAVAIKAKKEEAAEEKPSKEYSTKRLVYVRENDIPESYKDLSNPLDATEENIKRGVVIYRAQCSMCHGEKGLGDVPAGKFLNPPASNIAAVAGMPEATDGYLFWSISEGGAALRTQMLPFKSTLSEEDRWRVILYMRTLKAE
jgi:mono/diheme cytochrome c family protein